MQNNLITNKDNLTDEEIVLQIQKGNKDLYEEILNRYEKKIAQYIKRFLYEQNDRTDILQDIFIKVYINIKSFDTKLRFNSWIYRIAHNECINKISWKSLRNFVSIDKEELLPSFALDYLVAKENVEKEFEQNFSKTEMEKHLKELDEKYRAPVILYFLEDMSYEEIGEILKIPISTVGIRIKRGKDKLKNILEQIEPRLTPLSSASRDTNGRKK
jgi:RNA polymerase sigma-70 factor (ECF subfamily)